MCLRALLTHFVHALLHVSSARLQHIKDALLVRREPSDLAGNSLGSGDTLGLAQGPGPGAALGLLCRDLVALRQTRRDARLRGVVLVERVGRAGALAVFSGRHGGKLRGGRSSGSLASPETKYLTVLHRSRRGPPRARGQNLDGRERRARRGRPTNRGNECA